MMIGMAAAAAVFAGLALFSIAVAWGPTMTSLARVALMVLGGYLIAGGIGYVIGASPAKAQPQRHSHGLRSSWR